MDGKIDLVPVEEFLESAPASLSEQAGFQIIKQNVVILLFAFVVLV